MKIELMKKAFSLYFVFLFIFIILTPKLGMANYIDDTTPPITTCTLNPPYPDGFNGWYVNDINVTLNSTDDLSGVKEIYYRVAEGEWKNYSGDYLVFVLDYDCLINGSIEFYAVDFAGNQEEIKSFCCVYMDLQPPEINHKIKARICQFFPLTYEITLPIEYWDNCSGVAGIEIYFNNVLQITVPGPGPTYSWIFIYHPLPKIIIKIVCWDNAGNKAEVDLNESSLNPRFKSVDQYLGIERVVRFFYRCPLIQKILTKPFFGTIGPFLSVIPWLSFNKHLAKYPYDIMI